MVLGDFIVDFHQHWWLSFQIGQFTSQFMGTLRKYCILMQTTVVSSLLVQI
nr:hypothetical protein Iba_chr12dCG6000 [Ipomoea batatas]